MSSFNVSFYCMDKRINSTKRSVSDDSPRRVYACKANSPLDVLNPVVVLATGGEDNPCHFNYAYIPKFARFYWITGWVNDGNLWIATMKVDTLASWKDCIAATDFYITRTSAVTSSEYIDDLYPTSSNMSFSSSTVGNPIWNGANYPTLSDGCFVVGIAGSDSSSTGTVTYYSMGADNFRDFASQLFDLSNYGETTDLGDIAKGIINPMDYVSTIKWYPCRPAVTLPHTSMRIGFWDYDFASHSIPASAITRTLRIDNIAVKHHPQAAARGSWLNLSPFTNATMEVQPWGRFDLDMNLFKQCNYMSLYAIVDFVSGDAHLSVKGYTGAGLTGYIGEQYIGSANVGVDWATGASRTNGMIGAAASVLGGMMSNATLGGNLTSLIAPSLSAISPLVDAGLSAIGIDTAPQSQPLFPGISSALMSFGMSGNVKGANGSMIEAARESHYQAQFQIMADRDIASRGVPYCQNGYLVSGNYYTVLDGEVSAAREVDGATVCATMGELAEIKAVLESGFYYE